MQASPIPSSGRGSVSSAAQPWQFPRLNLESSSPKILTSGARWFVQPTSSLSQADKVSRFHIPRSANGEYCADEVFGTELPYS